MRYVTKLGAGTLMAISGAALVQDKDTAAAQCDQIGEPAARCFISPEEAKQGVDRPQSEPTGTAASGVVLNIAGDPVLAEIVTSGKLS